jgi:predicted nuclease of restriction endonuclease-like (RecB) superfamily
MTKKRTQAACPAPAGAVGPSVTGIYGRLVSDISGLLEHARRTSARAVNSVLTTTYWEIGRRIVEFEQGGKDRADYGEQVLSRLADDLMTRHGRGFSARNLRQMRAFFLGWEIWQTPSAKFEARAKCPALPGKPEIVQTPTGRFEARAKCLALSEKSEIAQTLSAQLEVPAKPPTQASQGTDEKFPTPSGKFTFAAFPLSWSHYVRLLSVENTLARAFYEAEAIRGGWSVRQLDRQIGTQFYERTAKARRPTLVLAHGRETRPEDAVTLHEEIRDPYLLEFLDLKDEYGESDLEEAIIRHLEWFLLELGSGFTFVARQKRIRIGDEWFRIDLLLFHRRLRCLVVIDLKIGKFTHADAGQMNLYLNYARENMMEPGENEPVGLILCSAKDDAVVHYAMGGIKANVFASQYLTALPDEETLRNEILTTQRAIRARREEEKHNG